MLILMRHGQTTSNVDRKLDTLVPGAALTPLGEEQARDAGAHILDAYDVTRVVSSEALRARQTAAIGFGHAFPNIPAVPGLQEVHAGRWEMQNSWRAHAEYLRAFRGFYRRDLASSVQEGDSLEVFLGRYSGGLMPFVQEDHETGGTTVVVSHGGAIRAFTANACEVDPKFAEQSYLPNCQYVVIDPATEPGADPAATFGNWNVVKWADYRLP